MSTEQILLIMTGVLACSCAGTLAIRLTNARLLGLGWLCAAFACGGLATALLCAAQWLPPLLSVAAVDVLVLLSFALLHMAVLQLAEVSITFQSELLLLGLQTVSDLVALHYGFPWRIRVSVAALLLALQTGHTGVTLLHRVSLGTRVASWFNAMLLFLVTLLQLLRGGTTALGHLPDASEFARFNFFTCLSYLAFTFAIGFGIFWLASSTLLTKLDDLASLDPLTRLYNRRVFLRWCERVQARSRESNAAFSVLIADLDHFKAVNDKFGHAVGDAVLCTAVERMQDAVRGIDILGRWGGEEFVALLPGASPEAAMLVAQRVRRNVERSVVPVGKESSGEPAEEIRVTLSVGVASFQGEGDTIDLMMARADHALYAAKASGRNQVSVDGLQAPDFFSLRHARTGTQ